MDVLAVKQACKFAKDHALENGPIVSISETTLIFLIWMHIL
jgi:pyruvate dehydrogenase E1 component alpha subunit